MKPFRRGIRLSKIHTQLEFGLEIFQPDKNMDYKAKHQLAIELKKASEELQNIAMDEELKNLGCDTLDWIKHFNWSITCSALGTWSYTGTPRDTQGEIIRNTLNATGSSNRLYIRRRYEEKLTAKLQALGYDKGHASPGADVISLYFEEEQGAKLIRESQMPIENAEELVSTLRAQIEFHNDKTKDISTLLHEVSLSQSRNNAN